MRQYRMEVWDSLTPEQQDCMIELEKEAFPTGGAVDEWTLVPIARHGRLIVYKGEEEKAPVAVCELLRDFTDSSLVYIFGFYVRPIHHGKRIGSLFLKEVLAYLKKEGFQRVSLTVELENEAALKLYEGAGFIRKERRLSEYGQDGDREYMVKTLD